MTNPIRRVRVSLGVPALLIAISLLPAVAPPASVAASGVSRSSGAALSFVLSPKDVRTAYGSSLTPTPSGAISNHFAQFTFGAIGLNMAVTKTGWVKGSFSEYLRVIMVRPRQLPPKGVSDVLSSVNLYKTSGDAHAVITNALRTKIKALGWTNVVSPLSGLGNSALLQVQQKTAAGLYNLLIGFQRGKYTAAIEVSSDGSKPAKSTALGLAKLIDSRIQAHH